MGPVVFHGSVRIGEGSYPLSLATDERSEVVGDEAEDIRWTRLHPPYVISNPDGGDVSPVVVEHLSRVRGILIVDAGGFVDADFHTDAGRLEEAWRYLSEEYGRVEG